MKVGIVGNYGHNNNGDEAILTGILHQLTDHLQVKKEDIVIFSNNPKNTMERYGINSVPLLHKKGNIIKSGLTTIKESFQVMKKLDLVIVGGGGLLMDMYKRDAPLYSTLGQTAKRAGCKVVIYGVGAGPIRTKLGTFFIKRLAEVADSISVRDKESQRLLKQIGVSKSVQVIGDPAFSVPVSTVHQQSTKIKKVGVTAVPYYSDYYWPTADKVKYQNYIEGMAQQLDKLVAQKDIELTFFSTKFPEDIQVTKDIQAIMKYKETTTLLEDNLKPTDIVELSAKQDLIIGTRLHSLILSVDAKTPIIGIGYHHKVLDFMNVIGKADLGIPINDLHKDTDAIFSVFEKVEENWGSLQEEFVDISNGLQSEALEGLMQLKIH